MLKRFGRKKGAFYSLHWWFENSIVSMTLWLKSLSSQSKAYITKAKTCILCLG